jgi:hypothetical protein
VQESAIAPSIGWKGGRDKEKPVIAEKKRKKRKGRGGWAEPAHFLGILASSFVLFGKTTSSEGQFSNYRFQILGCDFLLQSGGAVV